MIALIGLPAGVGHFENTRRGIRADCVRPAIWPNSPGSTGPVSGGGTSVQRRLPIELHTKLNIARCKRIGDLSTVSVVMILVWSIEVDAVECVEHLAPELQLHVLGKLPVLLNRQVEVLIPRCPKI